MGDFLEYRTQKQFEGLKEPYTPTTEEIRERFILGAMRRRNLEQEVADWDAWLASVKAEAWDEGHRRGSKEGIALSYGRNPGRIVNPYREVTE